MFMPTALDSKSCRDSSRLCEMYRKSTKRTSRSLLCWTAKNIGPLYRSCSVFRSDELHGKQCRNFPRGVVLFEPLSNRTTEITVRLRSSIESATLTKMTRDYLTNFKRVVERLSTP